MSKYPFGELNDELRYSQAQSDIDDMTRQVGAIDESLYNIAHDRGAKWQHAQMKAQLESLRQKLDGSAYALDLERQELTQARAQLADLGERYRLALERLKLAKEQV